MAKKRKQKRSSTSGAAKAAAPNKRAQSPTSGKAVPVVGVASGATGPAPSGAGEGNKLRLLAIDTRLLGVVVFLAVACGLVWGLRDLLTTFLFAGVAAFLAEPIVKILEKRRVPRAAGAALVLAGFGLLMLALSMLVLPRLISELADLIQRLPEAMTRLEDRIEAATGFHIPRNLSDLGREASDRFKLSDELIQSATAALKSGGPAVGRGAAGILGGLASAVGIAGQAVFIPVLAFFVLAELPELKVFLRRAVPARFQASWGPTLKDVDRALSSLIRGQLTVAGLMVVIYWVGLTASAVPLTLAIAILSGLAYLVPFASPTVCVALSVVFTLLEAPDALARPLIGCLVTAAAVQLIEGWVLTPRVVGESAGLSPLAVILAVMVAASLSGFFGVLFALPVATALAVIVKERVLQVEAAA